MIRYTIEGYFDKNQAEKIKQKAQGKTYFNFNVEYGGMADNNTVIVTSNTKGYTDEELKNMFIWYMFSQI